MLDDTKFALEANRSGGGVGSVRNGRYAAAEGMPGLTQGLPGMPGPPYQLRALPLAGIHASEPGSYFLPRFLFQPTSHWLQPLLQTKKPA